jgi:ligand-binding SRPBCC domain-containing protein
MKKRFTRQFLVPASLDHVSQFHLDSKSLRLLTPPPILVQFHKIEPLSEGSISDFTLWLGPIPIHWIAIHTEVDPLSGFTDTQVSGPFLFWQHRHRYHPAKSWNERELTGIATIVIDEIEAVPGKGLWNGTISRLLLFGLPIMFAYRAWRTRQYIVKNHTIQPIK